MAADLASVRTQLFGLSLTVAGAALLLPTDAAGNPAFGLLGLGVVLVGVLVTAAGWAPSPGSDGE